MIEQTLFALPFAYLGVLFANGKNISTWILVTIALASARTAGMSFNRVIDAKIDAKNPRTKDRLIPKGKAKKSEVWIIGIVSSLALVVSSYLLNSLCFYLSFAAVFLLLTYSYFKRFSSSSHFYLGFVEAAAPIGGYLAVTGEFSVVPFVLGAAILLWIAGLDIVYALMDVEFDKKRAFIRFPRHTEKKGSCRLRNLLCFILRRNDCGRHYNREKHAILEALACVAFIFIYQQKIARSRDIGVALKKFFKANIYVSPFLLIGTLIDVFL